MKIKKLLFSFLALWSPAQPQCLRLQGLILPIWLAAHENQQGGQTWWVIRNWTPRWYQRGAPASTSDGNHHQLGPDLISKDYVLASLSVPTSGETCLPAVAALFIIKPGMFQCRTYNLAFDKAWAQCCQPPLCNWNAFSAFLQRKRGFLWSQISPGFQELMQVMAWFCQAV